jgi:uncharacterized protein DUF2828
MNFFECLKNITYTNNNAISLKSSNNNQIDLFYYVLRDTSEEDIFKLADLSWEENQLNTLKIIAYVRDCRGGKGERECGRLLLKWLANKSKKNFELNLIYYLKEYGRFDDIIYVLNTEHVIFICKLFEKQLREDLYNMEREKEISLLSKWLPSENKSIDKKYKFYTKLCKTMQITKQMLRKYYITPLRKYLNIIESKMCSQQWDLINFNLVPSLAMFRYGKQKNVFEKRSLDKFNEWKIGLAINKTKVNASILFPHQIIHQYKYSTMDLLLEAQWKELIKKGKTYENLKNTIVLSDVSGSMEGLPIEISIALGLFISELANDNYKNIIITFEENPKIFNIQGESLYSKIESIRNAPWGGNTNFIKAIELILNLGINNKILNKDMPKRLIIVSDMQFDQADSSNLLTNYQKVKELFKNSNYDLPHLVFWNVTGDCRNIPTSHDDENVSLVSGYSIDILKSILHNKKITPYDTLLSAINNTRYDLITYI